MEIYRETPRDAHIQYSTHTVNKTIFPKNIPFLSNQEALTKFNYIISEKENFIKCKIQKMMQAKFVDVNTKGVEIHNKRIN